MKFLWQVKIKKAPNLFDAFVIAIPLCIACLKFSFDKNILINIFFVKKKMWQKNGLIFLEVYDIQKIHP